MPPKGFKPPSHVETYHCIFDRKTGEILATETRWIDEGAKYSDPSVSRELLRTIAEDSGRKAGDLDVLQTEPPALYALMRVDVSRRKLTVVRTVKKAKAATPPQHISKP